MIQSAIGKVMKEINDKHNDDIDNLNKKFDMFQATAIKGVIDALTGESSTLATKTDLNQKIENLHTTMDSIKQLIIDTSKLNSKTGRRMSKRKSAASNLKENQDSDMSDSL